jgi:hypothetical protein
MAIDAGFWHARFGVVPPMHLASMAASVALMILLSTRIGRTASAGAWAFFINNVFIMAAISLDTPHVFMGGGPLPAFQAQKLAVLTVALLAPPSLWSGLGSIALFGGAPLVELATLEEPTRDNLTTEPWAMMAYGMFAIGLYLYRIHTRRVERRMRRALAEAVAFERLARMQLAIRDVSNTPLQTLRLTNAVLRGRCPGERHLVERMDRALSRLCELNTVIAQHEPEQRDTPEATLDAAAILENRE